MALCFRGFFANTPQSQNLSSKMFKVFALDASAIWWRSVLACSMHVLSSISMLFYTVSLSRYMHRSSSWHLSDHGWAVTSMDLAVCQCLPIGTCRILHHSRRPFLNSPPYAALIHFMQFMHLYTFILYSVHLCPFGFGVYRKFPGIWTSAPRLANGMERFPVPHLVDFCRICQSILLAVSCWGGVDYQRQKKLKM